MCGIAGLLSETEPSRAREMAQSMASSLAHRGPDGEGVEVLCLDTGGTLALAHRRLAILDLSSAGHQPMFLDGRRLCISYNGEVYNYIELREELKRLGHEFVTETDTEVVLHAYDEWGVDCLKHFNGMWSFALWDSRDGSLFCSVDHCGIKPFFYANAGQDFAFASEPKALLELPWVPRKANRARTVLFLLSLLDFVDDRTMFDGIARLMPGHALLIRPRGRPQIWRWWKPQGRSAVPTKTEAVLELKELIADSIRLRFRSDVPVGISLSGGVDSTGLVCTAAAMARRGELQLPHGLRTFTATTVDPIWNEGESAARIASLCHADAFSVRPDAGNLLTGDLETLVRHQDEPFAGLSVYMQFCVARRVRESGTVVVLSGQGPDELFLGYPWQYPYAWGDLLSRGRPAEAASQVARTLRHGTVGWKDLLGYAAYAWAPSLRARRYSARVRKYLADPAALEPAKAWVLELFRRVDGARLLERETSFLGLPALMRYEDRNSMAFSVESRLPYLDHRIVELAGAVPTWTKLEGGWSKSVVRSALADVLPSDIAWNRRKIGFAPPEREFMSALAPLGQELFSGKKGSLRSAPLLNTQVIATAFGHEPEIDPILWRFLNLETWLRAFKLDLQG